MTSRREFIEVCTAAGAALLLPRDLLRPAATQDGWTQVPGILARIRPPVFARREIAVTQHGAKPDGVTDCTEAIRTAIEECHRAGGGRVLVPAGRFLTGPVHLRGNVELHLSDGAVLAFHQDPQRYLPAVLTRWEGVELFNYSPFIYALDQENVAVTGTGTIDGQADCAHWWPWKARTDCGWKNGDPRQDPARNRLFQMAEQNVAVAQRRFAAGDNLRPSFVQFYRCRNVLIEGITVRNSPMWCLHPVLSENVTVRRVRVVSHGPNNDGCNPESCRDVLIEDCYFDTGDDCIAIKSGRNADGRRLNRPSENIVVRNCRMKDGHGGVTIGSEASGGVRNVFAERCQMDSPNLERALRVKTNSVRGGTIENVFFRDIEIGQVSDSVLSIDFNYEEGDAGTHLPTVRNFDLRNVTAVRAQYALYLRGFARAPIRDVRLTDCTFAQAGKPNLIEHVEGLRLQRVRMNGETLRTSAPQ